MRLVQYIHLRTGQYFAKAFAPHRHVREQQMVIHHDQIGGLRAAARFYDVTIFPKRAFHA